jgi:hypothetical protein
MTLGIVLFYVKYFTNKKYITCKIFFYIFSCSCKIFFNNSGEGDGSDNCEKKGDERGGGGNDYGEKWCGGEMTLVVGDRGEMTVAVVVVVEEAKKVAATRWWWW